MTKSIIQERDSCALCSESVNLEVIYSGHIRSGGIGSDFVDGYQVIRCGTCDFVFLNRGPEDIEDFYETNKYRENFDYEIDISSMQRKFDPEQHGRINRIGIENLRGQVVADFGAGPGIFIDAIRTVSKKTVVVEPSQKYRSHLSDLGHDCFPYAEQMLEKYAAAIDVVVSFDTIEHVPDVKGFDRKRYQSLKPQGILYLSMPNLNDILRYICPKEYEPFYFQVAHVNYFNASSSFRLLNEAGFEEISVDYIHKYGINNILRWLKFGAPGQLSSNEVFDRAFHSHYVAEIERLGKASHLFITARKKGPL